MLYRKGELQMSIYFIMEGEVEFVFDEEMIKSENRIERIPYFTLSKGDIFGLEDYIYRLPRQRRHDLADNVLLFSETATKGWRNRRFTVRCKTKCKFFELKLDSCIEEWKRRFPSVANNFFRV